MAFCLGASGVRREPHDSAHVLGLVDGVDSFFLDSKKRGFLLLLFAFSE